MKNYLILTLLFSTIFFGCKSEDEEPFEDPTNSNQVEILIKVSSSSSSIIDVVVQRNFSEILEPEITLNGDYETLYSGDLGTIRDLLDRYDGRICFVQGLYDCQFIDEYMTNLLTLNESDYNNIPDGDALYIDVTIMPDGSESYYCDPFATNTSGDMSFTTEIDKASGGGGSGNNDTGHDALPSSVKGFLSESVYNSIVNDLGMTIYTGNNATCLEGSFVAERVFIDATTVSADPGNGIGPGTEIQPVHLSFCGQNNSSQSITVNWSDNSSIGGGEGSYYSGSGDQFTIFTQLFSNNSGVTYESLKIVSGTMTSSGIQNCEVVTFMIDNAGNPNGNLLGNNEGRLVSDDDGQAERKSSQACSGC